MRRVIEPLLAGGDVSSAHYHEDAAYARDLGLIALEPEVHVANPIYREVIVRVLAARIEGDIRVPPRHFVGPDGRLDLQAILRGLAAFWREHGEVLTGALVYREVAPQLVLMAYLQSIVNGTGFLDREYGVGRGRIEAEPGQVLVELAQALGERVGLLAAPHLALSVALVAPRSVSRRGAIVSRCAWREAGESRGGQRSEQQ